LRSALQLRGNAEAKELPFISAFLFYLGEEGVLLTKRRPFLSQTLSNPTAREKLLRCAQFLYVLSHCKFKICVFRMRVSVGQI
ncbi:hypothetical protein, partial [Campylobacter sp.]|uniref:hypothetical protein n=1 Tax=Campylobacter sp. TaxID=205 RepID=UPI0036198B97